MRHTKIRECGKGADGRGYQIIGDEQKRSDDRDDFAPMADARVNATAVGIQTADDHVVEADERGQHAHQADEPKRSVTSDGKREPDDVGLARAPVPIKNRRRALPIDITRSLDVSWYQLVSTQNEARSRDEAPHFKRSRIYDIPCTLMMLTRLAVGLEPLNALDAAHRSPRSFRNWFPR